MRVLAIDDDPSVLLSIRRQVQQAGFEVEVAVGGEEGLRRLESGAFDIVVCDWMMPDIDGIEICRQIRSDKARPFTYILMLTSRDTPDDILSGVEAGADDYMTKPVHESEVRARLTSAGRIVQLERDLAARVEALTLAMEEVKTLQGLLPICMYCHSIQDTESAWARIEEYLGSRTDVEFTHSICPSCYDGRVQPMLDRYREREAAKREEGEGEAPGRATGT